MVNGQGVGGSIGPIFFVPGHLVPGTVASKDKNLSYLSPYESTTGLGRSNLWCFVKWDL